MTIVACLGLGKMGSPIARNLVAAGFSVRVWNRNPAKTQEIVGATAATTPARAVAGAGVAVSMLADDVAVESVSLGPEGIASALELGGIHVGMSTISVALSGRLVAAHAERGQRFVAAPVFGRPEAAANRLLWIVPGGDPADLERCAPVFSAIGQGTFPMASAPLATLAKLIGNLLLAGTIEMIGEGLTLGEKAGLAPEALLDMLTGTLFGTPVFRAYGAMVAATRWQPAGFTLPLGLKDVMLVQAAARDQQVPLPLADLIGERMRDALARGRSDYDWAGFASVIREAAGLPERR